jgi:hypothetical protein
MYLLNHHVCNKIIIETPLKSNLIVYTKIDSCVSINKLYAMRVNRDKQTNKSNRCIYSTSMILSCCIYTIKLRATNRVIEIIECKIFGQHVCIFRNASLDEQILNIYTHINFLKTFFFLLLVFVLSSPLWW